MKFSGDGARFSSSSSFLLLSFSLPGTASNVLSGAGRSNVPNNGTGRRFMFLFVQAITPLQPSEAQRATPVCNPSLLCWRT